MSWLVASKDQYVSSKLKGQQFRPWGILRGHVSPKTLGGDRGACCHTRQAQRSQSYATTPALPIATGSTLVIAFVQPEFRNPKVDLHRGPGIVGFPIGELTRIRPNLQRVSMGRKLVVDVQRTPLGKTTNGKGQLKAGASANSMPTGRRTSREHAKVGRRQLPQTRLRGSSQNQPSGSSQNKPSDPETNREPFACSAPADGKFGNP